MAKTLPDRPVPVQVSVPEQVLSVAPLLPLASLVTPTPTTTLLPPTTTSRNPVQAFSHPELQEVTTTGQQEPTERPRWHLMPLADTTLARTAVPALLVSVLEPVLQVLVQAHLPVRDTTPTAPTRVALSAVTTTLLVKVTHLRLTVLPTLPS